MVLISRWYWCKESDGFDQAQILLVVPPGPQGSGRERKVRGIGIDHVEGPKQALRVVVALDDPLGLGLS